RLSAGAARPASQDERDAGGPTKHHFVQPERQPRISGGRLPAAHRAGGHSRDRPTCRAVLWHADADPTVAAGARADDRAAGPRDRRPSALRLSRAAARRRPALLYGRVRQEAARPRGTIQDQPGPLAPHRRPGLAYRDQALSEADAGEIA